MESITIGDNSYVFTKETLEQIEVMIKKEFKNEYKLLDKINDNLSFVGNEMGLDYKKKKVFSVDDFTPETCIIHFSNDIGDNIYIYKDDSIEIGKTGTQVNWEVTQLSYQNIIDIADYCKNKVKDES